MNRGSIMFWFMPCKMKVPGMYGFQMTGAGMLTLDGTTRISLRATGPPELAAGAAAGAVAASGAALAAAAVVGAAAAGASVAAGAVVGAAAAGAVVGAAAAGAVVAWLVAGADGAPHAAMTSENMTMRPRSD